LVTPLAQYQQAFVHVGDSPTIAGTSDILAVTQSITGASLSISRLDLAIMQEAGVPIIPGVLPCFVRGTRIATPRGAVAIERLQAGDTVLTLSGATQAIQWIGRRRVDCRRHAHPEEVTPIRILPHAFGIGRPNTALLLSPDHAVFVDQVLIPVRYLVNGTTVAREQVGKVSYYHLELPRHDVLLADGLPCESYLDTGNRAAFENGGVVLDMNPNFALQVWAAQACAPLVRGGPALRAVRRRMLDRAAALGFATTRDPALRLVAAGRVVSPEVEGRRHRFRLPAWACGVRLLSRSAVPAQVRARSRDHRRLGVAVARVMFDGSTIPLRDARLSSGWHQAEPDGSGGSWRWTDGDAGLAIAGVRALDLDIAMTERYWLEERLPEAGIGASAVTARRLRQRE
jgi:hypothetical protein